MRIAVTEGCDLLASGARPHLNWLIEQPPTGASHDG